MRSPSAGPGTHFAMKHVCCHSGMQLRGKSVGGMRVDYAPAGEVTASPAFIGTDNVAPQVLHPKISTLAIRQANTISWMRQTGQVGGGRLGSLIRVKPIRG